MIDNKKIGSRLEALRKEKKETQTDVAKLLGVQRQVISYYETGARLPNIEDLSILADHYNTTVDYLIGRTETKTVDEDIQMICNYTRLSETAVNRLHWILNHTNQKSISEIISFLIDPDGDTRIMNDLTYISGALYCYSKGYTELINNMRSHYDSINDLPIEKVKEISAYFKKETKVIKTDYNDVFDMFKKLVDDYVDTHIKTPEKVTIYKDFWQAIINREEDEQ